MPLIRYVLTFLLLTQAAQAEAVRGSLFHSTPVAARITASGVFIGRAAGGLFEDRPAHEPAFANAPSGRIKAPRIHAIRALIQEAESRREGYDAVQHGARIKPDKKPTQMTLAEIFDWIDATPGQPHAIGRYQFIPVTLRRVMTKARIKPTQRFSPDIQDKLADILLAEAGIHSFLSGRLERQAFMDNMAKIWAGLPNSTGRSHYDGYAGNKAAISWARFDAVMAQVSPR